MNYTVEMLRLLKRMPAEQLEELQKEWRKKYTGKEVILYLDWVIEKIKFIKK